MSRRQRLLRETSQILSLAVLFIGMWVSAWFELLLVVALACLVAYRVDHWRDVKRVQRSSSPSSAGSTTAKQAAG